MPPAVRLCWLTPWAVLACGCATGPLLENPERVAGPPPAAACVENPAYVALGPASYGTVFEKVLDVVDDYFDVSVANRYDGRIETFPRIAPGLEQPWKKGSADLRSRFEATLQTIRHRAVVLIQPADDGGFFVQVVVYKELEDLPRPSRPTTAAAIFRSDNNVERQFQVIDPTVFESTWIPLGRDTALEQQILQQITSCL